MGTYLRDVIEAKSLLYDATSHCRYFSDLSRHVIPKSHAAEKIEKTLQKAHATTADISSINLAQQFR